MMFDLDYWVRLAINDSRIISADTELLDDHTVIITLCNPDTPMHRIIHLIDNIVMPNITCQIHGIESWLEKLLLEVKWLDNKA